MFDLRTIAEVQGAGVKAGKHAEWKEQIIVPPLPQSALAGCSLIDIEYFIQVRASSPTRWTCCGVRETALLCFDGILNVHICIIFVKMCWTPS